MDRDSRKFRRLYGIRGGDRGPSHIGIDAQSPSVEFRGAAGHLDCGYSRHGALHPRRLVRHVVGKLILIEILLAVFTVPYRVVFLPMLHHLSVGDAVVAVDVKAVSDCSGVRVPSRARPVVCAPDPGMVQDGVVAVEDRADFCGAYNGAAAAGKQGLGDEQ